MMNKDMLFHHQQQQQPQQQVLAEENMSNLTSASGDQATSVSSGNITEASGSMFVIPQQKQCFVPQSQAQSSQPPMKKKRNQPGNPDPEAEVIALSPRTLLTANRFICEICNKGFKRDQNLQLHRRGHNLPWKLKQRSKTEVIRKKVYVCPEPTCVHHEPSRALGDLTGIKKHFCRKHGEKKWKCEKCSKRYAVQSDWKAHSMTCGTKEYRCDCGNLFSRRDSFVTHRAFCDALAEESERAIPTHQPNPTLIQSSNHQTQPNTPSSTSHQLTNPHITNHETQPNSNYTSNISNNNNNSLLRGPSIKKEQQSDVNYTVRPQDPHHIIPPWLSTLPGPPPYGSTPPPLGFSRQHDLTSSNPNPCGGRGGSAGLFPFGSATVTTASFHHPSPQSPAMSATALLQKVAQMGTMNTVPSPANEVKSSHNLATTIASSSASTQGFFSFVGGNANNQSMFQGYNTMYSAVGFEHGEAFEDSFGGFLRTSAATAPEGGEKNGGGGVGEGLTRDFMGLRPLCHSDILSFSDLGDCINDNASERQRQHSH